MKFTGTIKQLAVGALACLLIAAPGQAKADDVLEFYANNDLVIIVPFSPGGGIDLYARILGRHLGKHIPGNPAVVVQNRPGAGGLSGVNYLYNVAPKDGTHIGTMTPPNAFAPLMGEEQAQFDPTEFEWIGNMARDVASCVVAPHVEIESFDDVYETDLVLGATGRGAITAHHALALRNVLDVNIDVLIGYPGTREIWVAMERGEIDGACAIWSSLATGPLQREFEEGAMRAFVQLGSEPHPAFGDAPVVYDLTDSEEDRAVLRFIFGQTTATRPFFAPPGVPEERLAALRQAFMETMNDPELLAEAEEADVIIDPADAEWTRTTFMEILATPPDIVERAKQVVDQQDE